MTMKIGANSQIIQEISNGPLQAGEVDLIELSMKHSGILNETIDYDRLEEIYSLNTSFSIHAPCTGYRYPGTSIDFGLRDERNFRVMEDVFQIASYLDAEYVIVHGDKVNGDHRGSFLNLIYNLTHLSKMAEEYSLTLLLENLHNKNGFERMGIKPMELLQIIRLVNRDNLKIVFDVGHGNLTANQHNFDILEFFDYLSPYIYHMHIHDNIGIPAFMGPGYGDQHLPIGHGNIDFNRIFRRIKETKTKNLVLELKTNSREDAMKSIGILKDFRDGELRKNAFKDSGFIAVKEIGDGIVDLDTPLEAEAIKI
ncbi:MAG TPA: sugar phosphate isomerase/epimerase [Candidatus Altiarchaeales archaeon]|nr:sugar phosphate isomerase/epimerase [Candidatus Altiarchaeales archaeon]